MKEMAFPLCSAGGWLALAKYRKATAFQDLKFPNILPEHGHL
jgi:hypothetical protein